MKIVIVGAGISGLSAYLALTKHLPSNPVPPEIVIYEARKINLDEEESLDDHLGPDGEIKKHLLFSSGLGVGPNGMKVLRDLDQSLHDDVAARGYPTLHFKLQGANEMHLGSVKCSNDPKSDDTSREITVSISRHELWKCLRERVPNQNIICGEAVVRASRGERGQRPSITLESGPMIEADLIIGADGVWSKVKKAILGDGFKDDFEPHNENLLSVGGLMPSSYITDVHKSDKVFRQGQIVGTIGAEGFFGYGPCTVGNGAKFDRATIEKNNPLPYGPTAMWWSSFESEEYPRNLRDFDREKARAELLRRHGDCSDPVISNIIKSVEIPLMVGTWTTPTLPTWESDGLLILGDAAHTLPSTSGQGASQCLEDTYAFSLLLAHHIRALRAESNVLTPQQERTAIVKSARALISFRKPHVDSILNKARQMGNRKKRMNLVAKWFTYGVIMTLSGLGIMESFNSTVYNYDVQGEVQKAIALESEA